LKNKLSQYVTRVRSGEGVSITDRGEIIAELNPARRHARTGKPTVTLEELRPKGALYGGGPN
jgi:prevent-host-death family protein